MTNKELSQSAKAYLQQIYKTDQLIKRLSQIVSQLRSSLVSTQPEMTHDRVQSSHNNNHVVDTISKIIDLERDINNQIDKLVDLKRAALWAIRKIRSQDQRSILLARYVQGQKWEDIAEDMNYSLPGIYKLHGRALLNFQKVYSKV